MILKWHQAGSLERICMLNKDNVSLKVWTWIFRQSLTFVSPILLSLIHNVQSGKRHFIFTVPSLLVSPVISVSSLELPRLDTLETNFVYFLFPIFFSLSCCISLGCLSFSLSLAPRQVQYYVSAGWRFCLSLADNALPICELTLSAVVRLLMFHQMLNWVDVGTCPSKSGSTALVYHQWLTRSETFHLKQHHSLSLPWFYPLPRLLPISEEPTWSISRPYTLQLLFFSHGKHPSILVQLGLTALTICQGFLSPRCLIEQAKRHLGDVVLALLAWCD